MKLNKKAMGKINNTNEYLHARTSVSCVQARMRAPTKLGTTHVHANSQRHAQTQVITIAGGNLVLEGPNNWDDPTDGPPKCAYFMSGDQ